MYQRESKAPVMFFNKSAFWLRLLALISISSIGSADAVGMKTYIVRLSPGSAPANGPENWYHSFLPATASESERKSRIVFSYHNVLTGFAAKLYPEEVAAIKKMPGFLSASPDKVYHLHTTRTPKFLGLQGDLGLWRSSNYGKGVIIGLLDTGIAPGHPSFDDKGVPPPPAKWKGRCELKSDACNNKLIGARDFTDGLPVDNDGHGSHTSSTAAGNFVDGANALGNANGTAVGMAPLAHLAMYKVCTDDGCMGSAILAGLDAAVADGVDVLSLSIGGDSIPFHEDIIAIGTFSAIRKGIFVSCSAGNSGPFGASVVNEAPWILTVGASTVDRSIRATVLLGNNHSFDGESLFQPSDFSHTFLPLVYPSNVSATCAPGSFKNINLKGKVVLCDRGGDVSRIDKGRAVKDAGGAAMILVNQEQDGNSTLADAHVLPASHVSYAAGVAIKRYISMKSPVAKILFRGTITGVDSAPTIASFSSRGPNSQSPGVLKPDITGPGVSIIAAWPLSVERETDKKGTFNVISGTSMSCPHLSGLAALVKAVHPHWSPAAIKSAIMTTADVKNLKKEKIKDERGLAANLFAVGAGHVNPSKVSNPGLIYDIQLNDYVAYLCGLGYNDREVTGIVHQDVSCSKVISIPEAELNYPSFAIALGSKAKTYHRTVTNVGDARSTYTAKILPPRGVTVIVKPTRLVFSKANQKLSYAVKFTLRTPPASNGTFLEGAFGFLINRTTGHLCST